MDWIALGSVGAMATAGITFLLVIGTLVAVYWQTRKQRSINAVNMLVSLSERFDSERMINARRKLCTCLLEGQRLHDLHDPQEFEVLNFFETVGFLTRNGNLEKQTVWNQFCSTAIRYYAACERTDSIRDLRNQFDDITYLENFERLHNELIKIDCRAGRRIGNMYIQAPVRSTNFSKGSMT
jgi:hypothetical protein